LTDIDWTAPAVLPFVSYSLIVLKEFEVEMCYAIVVCTLLSSIGDILPVFVGPPQPKKSRVMRGTLIVKDGVRQSYAVKYDLSSILLPKILCSVIFK